MANRRGKSRSGDRFYWVPKSLQMVTAVMKLKVGAGQCIDFAAVGLHEIAWGSRVGRVRRRGLSIELWGVFNI